MSNLFWLTDEQMARLRPYFPKSHGGGLSQIFIVNRVLTNHEEIPLAV